MISTDKSTNYHIIMSGSGSRFVSFLGCLSYYQEQDPNFLKKIKTIIATSGGTIVGAFLSLGFDFITIKNYLMNIDFKNLKKADYLNFFYGYGLDSGDNLTDLMKRIIKLKLGNEYATLEDLYDITGVEMILTGTCLNTYKTTYFSYKTHPNMPLVTAIRISISIPFYFTHVNYNNKIYVDGALLEYFPISKIDELDSNDTIISIKLSDINENLSYRKINNIKDFSLHVCYCVSQNLEKEKNLETYQNKLHNHEENKKFHFLKLVTKINSLSLEIDKSGRKILFDDAYETTSKYMKKKLDEFGSGTISK
jgi:predicted acylesterase/phospholipase RssA